MEILHEQAPTEQNNLKANQKSFMTKTSNKLTYF